MFQFIHFKSDSFIKNVLWSVLTYQLLEFYVFPKRNILETTILNLYYYLSLALKMNKIVYYVLMYLLLSIFFLK